MRGAVPVMPLIGVRVVRASFHSRFLICQGFRYAEQRERAFAILRVLETRDAIASWHALQTCVRWRVDMRLFRRRNVSIVKPQLVHDWKTEHCQDEKRHRHHFRRFVRHVVHLLIARFPEERHEDEAEHIERRYPGGEECYPEEEIVMHGVPLHCAF